MTDDEYRKLQFALMENPEAGDVVPGSGGVRKFRWRAAGRGKRGGYRIIYFVKATPRITWMLTMYSKNEIVNIPAHVLRKIREEIEND